MVELVDTRDLKSLGLKTVRVRFPLAAPKKAHPKGVRFFWYRLRESKGRHWQSQCKNSPVDCFKISGRFPSKLGRTPLGVWTNFDPTLPPSPRGVRFLGHAYGNRKGGGVPENNLYTPEEQVFVKRCRIPPHTER